MHAKLNGHTRPESSETAAPGATQGTRIAQTTGWSAGGLKEGRCFGGAPAWSQAVVAGIALTLAPPVCAHFFVQSYSLPIPFWMYAFGAVGALLLSFIAVGVFSSVPPRGRPWGPSSSSAEHAQRPDSLSIQSFIALALLILCIASGLVGTSSSFGNFNMTFFWIVFVLGVPYLVAFVGDFYSRMNPWDALVMCVRRLSGHQFTGRLRNPGQFGHWPAVVFYVGFINLELFGQLRPRGLSVCLLGYSVLNVAGAWLFGRHAWFQQGEFFGVMLRLLGGLAPVDRTHGKFRLRPPFIGLLELQPADMGLVVFVLFMLSSTAFDGLHGTFPWLSFYWAKVNPYLTSNLGLTPRDHNAVSAQLYLVWQRVALVASPFIYLGVLVTVLIAMRCFVRRQLAVRELCFRFVLSLIPIALVYHVAHYFTLLLAQGGQIVRLSSDPLGLGWNLFRTSTWVIQPVIVEMSVLWHIEVGLILAGHVVSVWLAHVQALIAFDTRRSALLSQLPMLALMMSFTTFGLWILSLPLSSGG